MKAPMNRGKLLVLQVLVGLGFLVLWHLLTTVPMVDGKPLLPPFFFSTPLDVLARTAKDFAGTEIWRHLGITLLETVLAFAIGALGGIVVGFAFARRARCEGVIGVLRCRLSSARRSASASLGWKRKASGSVRSQGLSTSWPRGPMKIRRSRPWWAVLCPRGV